MRILIVGGTSFVGRAIAWAAFGAGHDVTVINRGQTPSDLPSAVTRLIGDRSSDLSALAPLSFDVTVDAIAYRPHEVAVLREALGDRGGHYIQISSISAYQDPAHEGATEDELLLIANAPADPDVAITGATYGPLKAACERAAHSYFGDNISIVRPTFVIGGHDATLRFPYWVERIRRGGEVAIPEPRTNALQYIDARDLGTFVVTLAEGGTRGAFHAAGPYPGPTYLDVMEAVRQRVGPDGTVLIPVNLDLIKRQHLETKFPLFSGANSETVLRVDPAKAIAAGLILRNLDESVDDVVAWWSDREWPSWWLQPEEERALLNTSRP
jgi:2'-hydroxyisoflavone reductase